MGADEQRRAIFESWETMAPGWERWRDRIDATTAPVREWLIESLSPRVGDTVLELAAGPGDSGLAAARLVGDGGRVISTDLVPAMVEIARRRELGAQPGERRAPGDGRRADRARGRLGRRCALQVRLHADAGPAGGMRGDAPRPPATRPPGAGCLAELGRAEPVDLARGPAAGRARPRGAPGARRAGDLRAGERGAVARAARGLRASRSSAPRTCRCASSTTGSTTT